MDSIESNDSIDLPKESEHVKYAESFMSIATLKSAMKRVEMASKNMNIIIDDILDLSKIDNHEIKMNMNRHKISDIVQTIVDEHFPIAASKGLELTYIIDPDCPDNLYTDDTRTYQILSNLVSNSIKYSNSGSIVIHVHKKDYVHFEIKDTGKGIKKSEINNLFRDYGRTSNSDIDSNGLGLCVCQKLSNLLGGYIEVKSEYKKGSSFTFVHPIRSNCKIDLSEIETQIQESMLTTIKGDILIVSNDSNMTTLMKLLLKWINYEHKSELRIRSARTEEQIKLLDSHRKYDIIFMDIDEDWPIDMNAPVIAMTANIKAVQKDRDPMYDKFEDVLLKPFTNIDVGRMLVKFL